MRERRVGSRCRGRQPIKEGLACQQLVIGTDGRERRGVVPQRRVLVPHGRDGPAQERYRGRELPARRKNRAQFAVQRRIVRIDQQQPAQGGDDRLGIVLPPRHAPLQRQGGPDVGPKGDGALGGVKGGGRPVLLFQLLRQPQPSLRVRRFGWRVGHRGIVRSGQVEIGRQRSEPRWPFAPDLSMVRNGRQDVPADDMTGTPLAPRGRFG